MSYHWKPSKSQARAFAKRMEDPVEAAAYEARKAAKAAKRRASSRFDYETAGGRYRPTEYQYHVACAAAARGGLTPEQVTACNEIARGYTCSEPVHHDFIHVVNEIARGIAAPAEQPADRPGEQPTFAGVGAA